MVRISRQAARDGVQAALAMAAEQELLCGVVPGLARVESFGMDELGRAWMAVQRLPLSLAEFVGASGGVDSEGLQGWMHRVLMVLRQFHDGAQRAHGNVSLGNVLLDEDDRIFLTEPAPPSRRATLDDDLFAVGTLIFQLVTGRTVLENTLLPPLGAGEFRQRVREGEVSALGDEVHGWREFTNRLLERGHYARRGGFDAVFGDLKDVGSLRSAARKEPAPVVYDERVEAPPPDRLETEREEGGRLWKIAMVLVLLLGVMGSMGYLHWGDRAKGVDPVVTPTPTTRISGELAQVEIPKELEGDVGLKQRLEKALNDRGSVDQIMKDWEPLKELKKLENTWSGREWKLAERAKGAMVFGADSARWRERFLEIAKLVKAGKAIELQWGVVDKSIHLMAREPRLMPFVSEKMKGFADADAALSKLTELADGMQAVARVDVSKIVEARSDDANNELVFPEPLPDSGEAWRQLAMKWNATVKDYSVPSQLGAWGAKLQTYRKRAEQQSDKAIWMGKLASVEADLARVIAKEEQAFAERLREFEKMRDVLGEQFAQYLKDLGEFQDTIALALKVDDAKRAMLAFQRKHEAAAKAFPNMKGKGGEDFLKVIKDLNLTTWIEDIDKPATLKLDFKENRRWTPCLDAGGKPLAGADWAWYRLDRGIDVPFRSVANRTRAVTAIEVTLEMAARAGFTVKQTTNGPSVQSNGGWLPPDILNKVPPSIRGDYEFRKKEGKSMLTNTDFPATWVTPAQAEDIAKKLGGSLPTIADWGGIVKEPKGTERLRGKDWNDWIVRLNNSWAGGLPSYTVYPNAGAMDEGERNPVAGGGDTGGVWLTSALDGVPPSGSPINGFHHAIGNAAEWVKTVKGPYVACGGSVVSLSKAEDRTGREIQPNAYQDVGFRLAVDAVVGTNDEALTALKAAVGKIPLPVAPQ